jgi:hypothetical protein
VTLIRRIDSVIPYEEVERPDDELPEGKRVLGQRGVPGFKLHRYRIVREGRHAVRERWNDLYPPTSQIIRVGTGKKSREGLRPEDDKHPEYLADELLILTQGIENEDGERGNDQMLESREPGKYGKAGWTEELGMPFFRGDDAPADSDEAESNKADDKKGKKG